MDGTGALAWAGTRVKVVRSPIQDSIKISKFEGFTTPREIGVTEGEKLFKTIGPEGS